MAEDLGDSKYVKARNKHIRTEESIRKDVIKALMGLRQGRDFIAWLLAASGVNQSVFSTNAMQMAFASGQANIGHLLLAEITIPDILPQYVLMLKEYGEKDVHRTSALDNASARDNDGYRNDTYSSHNASGTSPNPINFD